MALHFPLTPRYVRVLFGATRVERISKEEMLRGYAVRDGATWWAVLDRDGVVARGACGLPVFRDRRRKLENERLRELRGDRVPPDEA